MEATHLGLLLLRGDRLRELHLGREKLRERICELKKTTVARDGVTKEAVGVRPAEPCSAELKLELAATIPSVSARARGRGRARRTLCA